MLCRAIIIDFEASSFYVDLLTVVPSGLFQQQIVLVSL